MKFEKREKSSEEKGKKEKGTISRSMKKERGDTEEMMMMKDVATELMIPRDTEKAKGN